MDFCAPFPMGEMLFMVIDEYSRFPEVEIMRSTTAPAVILSLERIFATHGLPEKITSDNGPPFQSKEFNDFMKMKGIIHHKVTPLWPQANCYVESFMKPLTKAVRTTCMTGMTGSLPAIHSSSTTAVLLTQQQVSHQQSCYTTDLFTMEYMPLTLQTTSPRTSTEKQLPWISSARLK